MTRETLKELQAGQIPCLYVMNKADLVMEESELPKVSGDRIYLSAKQGIGLAELLELIQKKLFGDYRECTFFDSVYDGAAVSRLQEQALVRSISYEADGVLISVSCKESDAGRYAAYEVRALDDAETALEREARRGRLEAHDMRHVWMESVQPLCFESRLAQKEGEVWVSE